MAKARGQSPRSRSQADSLLSLDVRLDRAASDLASQVTDTAHRLVQTWSREVATAIQTLRVGEGGFLQSRQSGREVAFALSSGADRAQTHGNRLIRQLPQMAEYAVRGVRTAGVRAGSIATSGPGIDAFATVKRRELTAILDDLINQARSTVDLAISSRQLQSELIVEVREILDMLPGRMSRWADTALMEYSQVVAGMNTREMKAFLYSGPIDSRCRPFCLRHVGKVWSRGRIDRMDNGQLPNTFLTRGGYHCRHLWRAVTEARLVAMADTGQFVSPDVAARVQAAQVAIKAAPNRRRRAA